MPRQIGFHDVWRSGQQKKFLLDLCTHCGQNTKEKEGQHVVHSTGRGEEKQKKKGKNKPSSIYSAISPFQRFVSLPCLLDFIRKAVDGKEKYARVVEARVC